MCIQNNWGKNLYFVKVSDKTNFSGDGRGAQNFADMVATNVFVHAPPPQYATVILSKIVMHITQ